MLTGLSTFWFERTGKIVPNHLISLTDGVPEEARGRAMIVRKLEMLPRRVQSCAATSPARDGRTTSHRRVSGIGLPAGLRESDKLPEPIFTPAPRPT